MKTFLTLLRVALAACLLLAALSLWAGPLVRPPRRAQTIQYTNAPSGTLGQAGDIVRWANGGNATAGVQLVVSDVATATVEGSNDLITWSAMKGTPIAGGAQVSSATATGFIRFDTSGVAYSQVRCSSFMAGTIGVFVRLSPGGSTDLAALAGPGLPANASTATNQTGGGQKTQIVNGSGTSMVFADATANPTVGVPGAMLYLSDNVNINRWFTASTLGDGVSGNNTAAIAGWVYNGATWDRMRGDTTAGAWVQLKAAIPAGGNTIGAVTEAGTWTVQPGNTANTTAWKVDGSAVTQPVSGAFWQGTQPTSSLQLGEVQASPTANTVLDRLKALNTTLGSPFQAGGSIGNVSGTVTLPTGASTSAQIGEVQASPTANTVLDRLKVLNGTLGSPLQAGGNVVTVPATSGGYSVFRSLDVQNGTSATVDGSAGQIYAWFIFNGNVTSYRYVKFYNKTSATSADTPILTIPIPPGSASNITWVHGIPFGTAISVRATTAVADNDNGAPTANDVIANVLYK